MSLDGVGASSDACSGLMYAGVPAPRPDDVALLVELDEGISVFSPPSISTSPTAAVNHVSIWLAMPPTAYAAPA